MGQSASQPALFVYIPGEVRFASQAWRHSVFSTGAETNYTVLKVFISHEGCAKVFPSPDKIALPLNVSVFVMGLMWCGWHSQANSIQRASSLHLQPCSNVTEMAIMRILHRDTFSLTMEKHLLY